MKELIILLWGVFIISSSSLGQTIDGLPRTKIMTLGVFHFAYPNLDAVKTLQEDKISVLNEPYHSEIISISNAICDFKPTIIAIEASPEEQNEIDSLYKLYKNHKFNLGESEIYQLGFRIGKNLIYLKSIV